MQAAIAEGNVPVSHVALARYLASARLSTFAPEAASMRVSSDVLQSIALAWGAEPNEVAESRSSVALSGEVGAERLTLLGFTERHRPFVGSIVDRLRRVGAASTKPALEFLVRVDLAGPEPA